MARPISWHSRLRDIHAQVRDSPRDPYHRADVERLFRIKPRAARLLIELMPRQHVGTNIVIERVDLLEFLERALEADDLGKILAELRKTPPKPKRRKLRAFVPRDFEPGVLRTVSNLVRMRRGEITLLYESLEDLTSLLYQLATVLEVSEFERRFCKVPPGTPEAADVQQEVDEMFAELEEMEAAWVKRSRPAS